MKLLMAIDDKEFCHQLQNNKFYFFKSRLIDYCKQYGCEVRTAKKKDVYFKTCSKCGYVIDDIDIQNNYFECPKCESLIYKNDNNAINLYKIENYNIK